MKVPKRMSWIVFILLTLAIAFAFSFLYRKAIIPLEENHTKYKSKIDSLNALNAEIINLNEKAAYYRSDTVIVDSAKKFGYVFQNELIAVIDFPEGFNEDEIYLNEGFNVASDISVSED